MCSKTCLVLLVGLPGAGKSTLCQLIKQSADCDVIHVCFDDVIPLSIQRNIALSRAGVEWKLVRRRTLNIIAGVIGSYSQPTACESISSDLDLMFRQFEQRLTIEFKAVRNKDVMLLIDDNNYYRSMRYEYYQLARAESLGFCQIYLQCQLTEAINRIQTEAIH